MVIRVARACLAAAALLPPVAARLGQPKKPFMLKLTKRHDIDHDPNEPDHGMGYMVGTVKFGQPASQELHMTFSTTIATFVVDMPRNCSTPNKDCQGRHLYSPLQSPSSVDIQRDGRPVDPSGGRRAPSGTHREGMTISLSTDNHGNGYAPGEFIRDEVCLGERLRGGAAMPEAICSASNFIVAKHELFPTMPNDGLIGLAPPHGSPFSLLKNLRLDGLEPVFGYFVDDEAHNAELTFGGVDPSRLEEQIRWVPVKPLNGDDNQWLVDIQEVRVAGQALSLCGDAGERPCHGLLDSGSPDITVDRRVAPELLEAIKKEQQSVAGAGCHLPDLTIVLKGGLTLTLKVEDYAGPGCSPEIHTNSFASYLSTNLITFGEPVLRRYYTVYNWEKKEVAFAPAKVERSCARLQAAGVSTKGLDCAGTVVGDDTVLLLELNEDEI